MCYCILSISLFFNQDPILINALQGNSNEKGRRDHKEGDSNDDEYGSYYDYDYENYPGNF